jgi:nucleoid-associated protein YgaU
MKKIILIVVTVLLGFSSYDVLSMEAAVPAAYHKEIVRVYKGDTLWSIASKRTAAGEDVREVVDRIVRANKLDVRKHIQPGQKLIVPTKQPTVNKALAAKTKRK